MKTSSGECGKDAKLSSHAGNDALSYMYVLPINMCVLPSNPRRLKKGPVKMMNGVATRKVNM